jgi:choline dehydrogenase-like flavoprotein
MSGLERTFPDEDLPEGSVVDGALATAPLEDAADFVVVGTGAAGASAARVLAGAGHSVLLVEEGPYIKTRAFGEDVRSAFKHMMRDAGTQAMEGRSFVPMIQGRVVGGSTLINAAIAWRTPEDVLDDWSERFGLGRAVRAADLEPHFDALEEELSVRSVADEVLGENNRSFLQAAKRRGFEAAPMRRYDAGCRGTARCLTGCPHGAKQGMNVTYVPWVLRHGGRLYASCKVARVEISGGRAVGVFGKTASGKRFDLRARRGVLVAASTVQTPNILRRSGIRARALGKHFQAHPGIAMTAVFDRPIRMEFGAMQGAESIHYRKTERFKIETITMPPELLAARVPGAGVDLVRRLAQYPNIAVWAVQIRARSEGEVVSAWGGGDKVKYTIGPDDVRIARRALSFLSKLMFEHGAKETWPGVFGLPHAMTSADQVKLIDDAPLDPRAYGFIATHLFGAARMGPDPRSSVVGLDFATHEARDLWVVDSSIFPTNLGVNPQHSIMAIARLAASRIADAAKARAA